MVTCGRAALVTTKTDNSLSACSRVDQPLDPEEDAYYAGSRRSRSFMPVAIAGVHRSGTSLIARALSSCGLYLGDENELMPPGAGNDEGFWENVKFVEIND